MPHIDLDGVVLWYDTIARAGSDAAPALLIQGLGMQATDWPVSLLSALAQERPLIRFDNRDAGLSQLFGPSYDPKLRESDFPDAAAPSVSATYTLFDMADDAVRLLDALRIPAAHLVGFSMGGMIGQIIGARNRDRVLSVAGLMTSAGQAWLDSTADADSMMRRSVIQEPDEQSLIDFQVAAEEIYAGPTPLPHRAIRTEAARQALARGYHSAGIWRQAMAMRAAGDRSDLLRTVSTPLLMLHGADDPVIALSQARAIEALIPATRFIELPHTGHVLTEDNGTAVAEAISAFWQSIAPR